MFQTEWLCGDRGKKEDTHTVWPLLMVTGEINVSLSVVLFSHQRALELATKVSFPVGEGGHTCWFSWRTFCLSHTCLTAGGDRQLSLYLLFFGSCCNGRSMAALDYSVWAFIKYECRFPFSNIYLWWVILLVAGWLLSFFVGCCLFLSVCMCVSEFVLL